MSDLFNPYIEFLDVNTAPKVPTYYELLGISSSEECTDELVENGRITALAKMRAFKPGANAAVWAAVLDEVAIASKTLLSVDLKATYDEQLATGEAPATLDLAQRLGPIQRIEASSKDSIRSSNPVDSMAPSHLQSGATASVRAAATQPVIPTAVAVSVTGPVSTATAVEVAIPVAQPIDTALEAVESFDQSQVINEFEGPQIKGKRRLTSRKENPPLLIWLGIGSFLVTGALFLIFFEFDGVRHADATNHDASPADTQLTQKSSKPDEADPTTKPDTPNVAQPKPRPPAPPLEKPLNPVPPDFGNPQSPKPNPPVEPEANSPPKEPDPSVPKPAPKPIEPAELEQITAALKFGRAALSDRNLDVTAEQLAIVSPLARSGEPRKAYMRLKSMHEFMSQFIRLSNEAIDNYESGAEIKIGTSTVVVVVETSPQELTIRVAGQIKTYLRNQLSTGLALGIADSNFDEFEYKSTLKAAFVITQKTMREFEVKKAREFWEMGPEPIEVFEGFISDDYEFAAE